MNLGEIWGSNRWHIQVWVALAACIVAYFLLRYVIVRVVISRFVKMQLKRKASDFAVKKRIDTLVVVTANVLALVISIVFIFVLLNIYGISITASIAGLGVIGIAIGFGAQSLLQDWIKGFFILAENQYGVGDVVKVKDMMGVVEDITLRKTVLRDLDGGKHIIPHGEIGVVSNYTQEWSRAHLNISVAYKEDLDRVMETMKKTWEELASDPIWSSHITANTPSILRVNEFGDSGIIIKLVAEVEPIQQWAIMGEYRRRIKRVFDEEGIEIPWPHTKVYFGDALSVEKPAE